MKLPFGRLLPGENTRLLVVAASIGLAAGLLIIAFRESLAWMHQHFFLAGQQLLGTGQGGWQLLLLPLLPLCGMLLLIPLALLFPGEVNGYGFPSFLHKVNIEGGAFRLRTIFLKMLATVITIGTGNSAGMAGPTAHISGALGSQFGRLFHVSGGKMKVFIAAGCAGGFAGLFNAPVAGMFFAAEIVLLGTFEIASFAALVVASAMATVVTRAYFGEHSIFVIPRYTIVNPLVELPLYCLLAVLVGFLAVLFIRLFYLIRDAYLRWRLPPLAKPLTGALAVGTLGILFPQVMGDGSRFMEQVMFSGGGLGLLLLALIFMKMLATAITLGAGGAGGVFAPILFIGTMIGGSFGALVNQLLPGATAGPGAYASVGLGAFLAATTHAPMTAIFLLFEMTGNYHIIVPAMLSCIIGTMVATWLDKNSIDKVDFRRAGIDFEEGRETAVMQSVLVGAAISEDVDFISEDADVNQLLLLFSRSGDGFYLPVIDTSGQMCGIISLSDVKSILHLPPEQRERMRVGELCHRQVFTLTPNDTLYTAMQLFDSQGYEEIPVVENQQQPWVVGMLKRRDALALYHRTVIRQGVLRGEALRHH